MTLRPTASRLCDWLVHKLVASLSLSLLEEILFVLSTPRHTRATRSLTRIHAPLRDIQSFAKKRKVARSVVFSPSSLDLFRSRALAISPSHSRVNMGLLLTRVAPHELQGLKLYKYR